MKNVVVVFQTAPHGSSSGREGLDLVLSVSTFIERISVVFVRDGIVQLLRDQQPASILQRNYSKTFRLFNMYDINDVYVLEEDLKKFGLKKEELITEVKVLTKRELIYLLRGADHKLVY